MQTIVANLIFQDGAIPGGVTEISPWIGMRTRPLDELLERLEAQTHRRFIKSHLALDGLPYHENVKYIVVGRDARDVFMSLWNHYRNHTPEVLELMDKLPGRVGDSFPPCPDDIRVLWRDWITRGWFEWEQDGWPYWSHLHHAQTWWDWRHLPNLLFVHFNDLLDDLEGEIRRVAAYLEIEVPEDAWPRIVDAATFATMKRNAEQIVPEASLVWKGGARQFIHKGTNGRWREVLTQDDLTLYPKAIERTLSPDCAHWLESGRHVESP
jgi:aryl sulfotransferase